MDVCHIVNTVGPTSIPADIAAGLNKRDGINAGMVAWFDAEPFRGYDDLEIHSLKACDGFSTLNSIRKFKKISRRYDILHTHHTHSGSIAKFVGKIQGKTIVSTENAAHDRLSSPGYFAHTATNVFSDTVICVSDSVHDSFGFWGDLLTRDNVVTIYNGVDIDFVEESRSYDWDLSAHADINDENFILGHVGALKPVKSQRTLIDAAKLVNDARDLHVEVVIAGDGPLRDELEAQVAKYELEDSVHFLGRLERPEVYRLLYSVDGFAMPSRNEAFCVAVAEAMATETPCILSDIRVFNEVYDDAAVFHPVDDQAELARCIEHLGRDADARDLLARKGNALVSDNYSLDTTIDNYIGVYDNLLS